MRYIYYANDVAELFYEKPDYIDPNDLIEVSDDFELDPNRIYLIDSNTKEISSAERVDHSINLEKSEETNDI